MTSTTSRSPRPLPPAGLCLRPARVDDLAAVRPLLLASDLTDQGVEDFFGEAYAVAEQDGRIVGRIVGVAGIEVYSRWGLLRSVAVAAELRGCGLGEALVRDRLDWARGKALSAVFLLTTAAPLWYLRFGFTNLERSQVPPEVQASPEFSGLCPAHSVVMGLTLAP